MGLFSSRKEQRDDTVGSLAIMDVPYAKCMGMFANIYLINHPNVGKFTIHGACGYSKPS